MTSTSYKPSGYFSAYSNYYLAGAGTYISGASGYVASPGDNNGYVRITEYITTNYTYNGSYRTVTMKPGTYTFECWGADGGYNSSATLASGAEKIYGHGGYAKGTVKLTSAITAYIYVGGQGSYATATTTTIQGGGYPDGGDFRSSA